MSEPLFDNVGKNLKQLATVLAGIIKGIFYVLGFIHVVLGIVCLASGFEDGVLFAWALGAMVVAAIWFVVGHYLSRLIVMGLYGYGEIVERIVSIEQKVAGDVKSPAPKPTPNPKPNVKPATTPWVCPFCDQLNSAGTIQCKKCNAEYNCWEEAPR